MFSRMASQRTLGLASNRLTGNRLTGNRLTGNRLTGNRLAGRPTISFQNRKRLSGWRQVFSNCSRTI